MPYMYAAFFVFVALIALRDHRRERSRARVRRIYNKRREFYRQSLLTLVGLAAIVQLFIFLDVFDELTALVFLLYLLLVGVVLLVYWYLTPLPSRRRKSARSKEAEPEMIPRGAVLMVAIRRQKILAQRNRRRRYYLLLSGMLFGLSVALVWVYLCGDSGFTLIRDLQTVIVGLCLGIACSLGLFVLLTHRLLPVGAHCPHCMRSWEISELRRILFRHSIFTWRKCPGCGLRMKDQFPESRRKYRKASGSLPSHRPDFSIRSRPHSQQTVPG